MNNGDSDWQTGVALGVVALTAGIFIWNFVRGFRQKRSGKGGCGGCGCSVVPKKPG